MTDDAELDRVIEIVLTDAYGEDEEAVAWETVLEDVIDVPAQAELLGETVAAIHIGVPSGRAEVTARCRKSGVGNGGEVSLADLTFPPQTEAAWIHAAYRRYLGLAPFPAGPRPSWTWPPE
ncbi:calcium-binding protein [Streptantibioticus ferralitis]|uniref:Calcium-binding protein n=1 Tax=Streptantibioticus ferralitis TaxID=236510 RepID=A0ABT5YV71_9ACTN|nr:calcium-binding protein [Streptantibioticus ferralitis]MDF2255492.1 calcium-binding protein [Streptantibioticus ferralitis]